MKKKIFFQAYLMNFIIALFIGQNNYLLAQTATSDSTKTSFRLFEDDKLLETTLRFDLSTYLKTRPKKDYVKANITIHLNATDSLSKNISLRTRGIWRNSNCTYPPIELNFKKAGFGYSDLDKISKLKMVVECKAGKDNEDYLLREYLAYKLFNVFTDTSFRVRLLKVNYIDTQNKKKPFSQYGILIEPAEMLTARTNCMEIKSKTLNQKNIIPKIMDRFAIFNYMIGNFDWSVPGTHNVLVIKSLSFDPTGLGIAIPYDFDWTGIVNASYALPSEEIGTENIRERRFEGICRTKEVYAEDLKIFSNKKEELYKVINEFPYINQKVKKDITGYLDQFFDQLSGRPDLLLYNLVNSCKSF